MIYHSSQSAGFTLVEVFVAITILLLVVVGPLRMLTTSTTSTQYASEQVVAYFLAQEGLELVQQARDNLVLGDFKDIINNTSVEANPWTALGWDRHLGLCINNAGCGLVPTTTFPGYATTSCASGGCLLYMNDTTTNRARYTHTKNNLDTNTENQATPYTRTIKVSIIDGNTDANGPQGLVATSTVTWRSSNMIATQKVELVTYLTNVYDSE
jgi:Tfp pilus assembly protein PilV